MDAYGHLKAIGASKSGKPLLEKAGVELDEGIVEIGKDFVMAAGRRYYAREAKLRALA